MSRLRRRRDPGWTRGALYADGRGDFVSGPYVPPGASAMLYSDNTAMLYSDNTAMEYTA